MKLTNTQIKKLKSAAKLNAGTTLRISKKNFQEDELPHELFLTRNVFGKTFVRAGRVFNLFISNEDIDDIIKII